MREPKFRIWNQSNKKYLSFPEAFLGVKTQEKEKVTLAPVFENDIIEQYTGLKDKNGKEIYEGDIIEVETCIDEEEITTYEVYWDEGTLEYALKTIKGVNYDSCIGELSQSATNVIGNIHENPELLGDGE